MNYTHPIGPTSSIHHYKALAILRFFYSIFEKANASPFQQTLHYIHISNQKKRKPGTLPPFSPPNLFYNDRSVHIVHINVPYKLSL